jgi:tetratricopeptide (TPR) repeat protein
MRGNVILLLIRHSASVDVKMVGILTHSRGWSCRIFDERYGTLQTKPVSVRYNVRRFEFEYIFPAEKRKSWFMNQTSRSRRKETNPLLIGAITLVAFIALAVISLNILRSIPSRYLSRFPTFVQHWVIPEPESAVLPAAVLPLEAVTSGITPIPSPTLAQVQLLPTSTPIVPATALPEIAVVVETTEAVAETVPITTTTTLAPQPESTPLPTYTRIENITHHQQDWNNCGPATLAMGLSVFGEQLTQYDTAAILKPNPEDRNVAPYQMADFVNENTSHAALERVNGTLEELKTLLASGFPVILEVGLDPPGEVAWLEWYGHYVLAVGYDDAAKEFWVFDSLIWDAASLADQNSTLGRSFPYAELLAYWPQFNNTYVVLYERERQGELATLLGDSYDDTKMWQASLERNELTVQNQPTNAFAWFNIGTSHLELGQYAEAVAAYDKARSIGLPWRMLWYQFGPYEAYYQQGRYNDIILLADATLEGRPYFEESFYWRGRAYEALGNVQNARSDYAASADFNPYFQPAKEALMRLNG